MMNMKQKLQPAGGGGGWEMLLDCFTKSLEIWRFLVRLLYICSESLSADLWTKSSSDVPLTMGCFKNMDSISKQVQNAIESIFLKQPELLTTSNLPMTIV